MGKHESRKVTCDGSNATRLRTVIALAKAEKEDERVTRLFLTLTGKAMVYAETVNLLAMSFDDAVEKLQERFAPPVPRDKLLERIASEAPVRGDKARDFVQRMNVLCTDVGEKPDDFAGAMGRKLLNVLRPSVVDALPVEDAEILVTPSAKVDDAVKALSDVLKRLTLREKLNDDSVFRFASGRTIAAGKASQNRKTDTVRRPNGSDEAGAGGDDSDSDAEETPKRTPTGPASLRLKCEHCGFRGHTVERCWKLHPELRPTRSSSRGGVPAGGVINAAEERKRQGNELRGQS